ncbi:MAG: DNA alkylation repair protein [Paludibacter sp.]|nr:DNA alkylation repair protein [Paludibacter sp.]
MQIEIREKLLQISEPQLRKFNAKLIPNIDSNRILGIRLNVLRTMAKEIVKKTDWQAYLAENEDVYIEETFIRGYIINYAKISIEQRLMLTSAFVPRIDNWAVCDSFCFKVKNNEKPLLWEFIQPYLNSNKPYDIRFGTIEILNNFVDNQYISDVFEIFEKITNSDYYVRMGIAWTLADCFIKLPEQTLNFLQNNNLNAWTHNKAIQKIIESRRVDIETKDFLRTLKRK